MGWPLLCSFQSPVEVPGVSNSDFLRLAANARRKELGQEELGPLEFYGFVIPKVCLELLLLLPAIPVPSDHSSFPMKCQWASPLLI